MDLDFSSIVFWTLAIVAVVSAGMVLFARDIVRVAFWLLSALSAIAGFYVLLDADFLGFTQVLVYIGGILVLILFGIMMTQKDPAYVVPGQSDKRSMVAGLLIAATTFSALLVVITGTEWKQTPLIQGAPTTAALGKALLTDYILPFELVSVLLVFVLCGAAYMARRRKETDHA